MNDFIESYVNAIKKGDLVEAKKIFCSIMEEKTDSLRQELRVQLSEAIRVEGEEDEDDDEDDEGDQDPKEDDKQKEEE